jgi:hypothetical protein
MSVTPAADALVGAAIIGQSGGPTTVRTSPPSRHRLPSMIGDSKLRYYALARNEADRCVWWQVINQSLVGYVLEAKKYPGVITRVLGARHGIKGILEGDISCGRWRH